MAPASLPLYTGVPSQVLSLLGLPSWTLAFLQGECMYVSDCCMAQQPVLLCLQLVSEQVDSACSCCSGSGTLRGASASTVGFTCHAPTLWPVIWVDDQQQENKLPLPPLLVTADNMPFVQVHIY